MRIILVHNIYQQAGGEDLVFRSECELLKKAGHQVDTLVFDNRDIRTPFQKVLSGIKAIYNPASARQFSNRIKEFKPDVIHVHNFFPLASPSIFFVANKVGIPVVVTLHNYRLICPSATLFHNHSIYETSVNSLLPLDAIVKGVYRNSRIQTTAMVIATRLHNFLGTWKYKIDKFIVLTDFARRIFDNSVLRTLPGALVVKPNFVNDCGPGAVDRENFFLFIGRLSEEKGVGVLLASVNRYKYNLVVIGDGPWKREVTDFASANSNVLYLGYQDNAVVMRYLKKCKALIFPSLWYEGFPMTILEAFSASAPVIASRLGAMIEVVQNDVNGLHFEAGDADDLIDKIKMLESQPAKARKMSESARTTYLNQYTPEKNYILLLDIYNQLLHTGRRLRHDQQSN